MRASWRSQCCNYTSTNGLVALRSPRTRSPVLEAFDGGLTMDSKGFLKSIVVAKANEGRRIRVEKIRTTSGPERSQAWYEKRSVGQDARVALLAYAFVRGRSYRLCEAKANEDGIDHHVRWLAARVARVLVTAGAREEEKGATEELVLWLRGEAAEAREAA
jgi:hypothetical protein